MVLGGVVELDVLQVGVLVVIVSRALNGARVLEYSNSASLSAMKASRTDSAD